MTQPDQIQEVTFLAINDEVSLFIPCGDGIDYTVSIWVFGQNRGNEGVGAGVLGDKCPVSAKKVPFNKPERRTIHMDGSLMRSEASAAWLDL